MKHSIYLLFCFFISQILLQAQNNVKYPKVEARQNALDPNWVSYEAKTVDKLPAFKIKKQGQDIGNVFGYFGLYNRNFRNFSHSRFDQTVGRMDGLSAWQIISFFIRAFGGKYCFWSDYFNRLFHIYAVYLARIY